MQNKSHLSKTKIIRTTLVMGLLQIIWNLQWLEIKGALPVEADDVGTVRNGGGWEIQNATQLKKK